MWRQIFVAADEEFAIYISYEVKQYKLTMFDKNNMAGYCEKISDEELMRRTKHLNRKVKYPEETVRKIILIEEPVNSTLVAGDSDNQSILKLKYRESESGLPFHSEWNLTRMETSEIWSTILTPLIQTVSDLYGQVVELHKCVREKDTEIKQYKVEGAQLRRSTVATKPFDFTKTDAEHKVTSMQIKGYQNFGAYLRQVSKFCKPSENPSSTMKTPPKVQTKQENTNENLLAKKESPRNRKRKANEFGKVHLERKVIQRRQAQKLLYKNSQSQSDSQDEELVRKLTNSNNDEDTKPSTSNEVTRPETPSVPSAGESPVKSMTLFEKESPKTNGSKESNRTKSISSLANRKSITPPAAINVKVENLVYDEQGLSASLMYETSTDESYSVESPKVSSTEKKKIVEKATQINENTISQLPNERKRKHTTLTAPINGFVENNMNNEKELSHSLIYETSTDESLIKDLPKPKTNGQVTRNSEQQTNSGKLSNENDKRRRRELFADYDLAKELDEIEQCMDELNEIKKVYDNL